MWNNLAIGMSDELVFLFQTFTELKLIYGYLHVVVDFSVGDRTGLLVLAEEGLVSVEGVNN